MALRAAPSGPASRLPGDLRGPHARPEDAAVIDRVGITVYGCEPDEADLFHAVSPRLGIAPSTTSAVVSDATVAAVAGNRSISVGHKSEITGSLLRALREA